MSRSSAQILSVIVPCRNERNFIEPFVESVFAQALPPGWEMEVLIADGMSDDGTRAVLERMQSRHPSLVVMDNPARITPAALNLAIAASKGEVLARMDVHAEYARDYLYNCLKVLEETGAENVGGVCLIRNGKTLTAQAIAAAMRSPYATGGGALSGKGGIRGPVDSVQYGCWRREVFEKYGMFDEVLVRNQDDEHNLRITRGGGTVWQDPRIRFWYVPRQTLGAVFRQYVQYGYWKAYILKKHKIPASIRHLVPGLFVAALLFSTLLAPFLGMARVALLAVAGAYAAFLVLASCHIAAREGNWALCRRLPLALPAFHLGYGYGFLRGTWDVLFRPKAFGQGFTELTRAAQ